MPLIKVLTLFCVLVTCNANYTFIFNLSDCISAGGDFMHNVSALEGEVYLLGMGIHSRNLAYGRCFIHIEVPEGMFIQAWIDLTEPCTWNWPYIIYASPHPFSKSPHRFPCHISSPLPVLLSTTNHFYFYTPTSYQFKRVRFRFKATESSLRDRLPVVFTSQLSGYMTSPGYNGVNGYPSSVDVTQELQVPTGYVIMVSFQWLRSSMKESDACFVFAELLNSSLVAPQTAVWKQCHNEVYKAMVIKIRYVTPNNLPVGKGFKMLFSFHPEADAPQKLENGLFNCSVGHYSSFRQHLDCNLEPECQEGQDETERCPYSSPACRGKVASRNKCFFSVSTEVLAYGSNFKKSHDLARQYCRQLGGNMATIKSVQEVEDLSKLFQFRKDLIQVAHLGVNYIDESLTNMYRKMLTGDDGSVLYTTDHVLPVIDKTFHKKMSLVYYPDSPLYKFSFTYPGEFTYECIVCERRARGSYSHDSFPMISKLWNTTLLVTRSSQPFIVCPDGHATHGFLSCDPESRCGQEEYVTSCAFPKNEVVVAVQEGFGHSDAHTKAVAMYTCSNEAATLPYTLVCDFRNDCHDHSDEYFCKHPSCIDHFQCDNGQCVTYDKHCDLLSDCLDSSDEENCVDYKLIKVQFESVPPPPALITFDGTGNFTRVKMELNESCPDTHYRCPGELNYCLPVYTRCNGVYDCIDREDEQGCEEVTCPGFYRCRASSVCVHVDHVCDGWPQCPQHDDEWLCEMTCPAGCLCQGLAFLCQQPFAAHLFPQLRYLDAGGSGMSPANLTYNVYLVYLSLARCSLAFLPEMKFPNLQVFDLSENKLVTVKTNIFLVLYNLKIVSLARNPLSVLFKEQSGSRQHSLKNVDLSYTQLRVFESDSLSYFTELQRLNISYTSIHTITTSGLQLLPTLTELSMTGSPVRAFPIDIFKGLTHLRKVFAQNYKLCCKDVLPEQLDQRFCFAPQDEISSCDDLLQSGVYRGFLWLISSLSVTGNGFCLVIRFYLQKSASKSGFNVFVTNLCLADLLMGVYSVIIGVADELFRGRFLYHDTAWKSSAACKVAGFLSLLSSEVSALTIWLITLDRFIVLRFPFSSWRFQRGSAAAACLMTWFVGCALAAVPLLPVTSHWEFYGQTGICIPLPVTRRDFKGRSYSFSVIIILNFILFLLIAAGQGFIYWSVQQNAMTTDTTRKSRDGTIARRLVTVAVTDFLCWFPIGVCGLMALAGVSIPGEINVAMAVFVLPLNSALNPFLYTFNLVTEKQKKASEERLLKKLESSILSKVTDADSHNE